MRLKPAQRALRSLLALSLVVLLVADTRPADARCDADAHAEGAGWSVTPVPIRMLEDGTSGAIVFVHGLDGHHRCTFYNPEVDGYWFDLVARDTTDLRHGRTLADFDIYSIDYRASFESEVSVPALVDQLVVAVEASGLFERYEHVWFVTHSLGGIAVKRLLTAFRLDRKDRYLKKVVGVSLIGVPSHGSKLAEILDDLRDRYLEVRLLADLFGPNAHMVRDLRPSEVNSFLQATETDWRSFRDTWLREGNATPRIYCAYETRPVLAGVTVVPELFTETTCDGRKLPVNADHITMVKPGGRNGIQVHEWLRLTMGEAFDEWERSVLASYGGGESVASLVARLETLNRDYDRWTRLPLVEFSMSYADESSRAAAERLPIPPGRYVGPSWLRLLEVIDAELERLSLKVSPDRHRVVVAVR